VIGQDIPYRDPDTYKLSLKMEFKAEAAPSHDKVNMLNKKDYDGRPKLYLNASLELLTLVKGDYKIKVFNSENTVLVSRKLKSPTSFLLKLGFAHKMKNVKSPNTFTINFINKEKTIISKIYLEVKEGGDFMVNGKRFGKI
jgi:hypothetical protein